MAEPMPEPDQALHLVASGLLCPLSSHWKGDEGQRAYYLWAEGLTGNMSFPNGRIAGPRGNLCSLKPTSSFKCSRMCVMTI